MPRAVRTDWWSCRNLSGFANVYNTRSSGSMLLRCVATFGLIGPVVGWLVFCSTWVITGALHLPEADIFSLVDRSALFFVALALPGAFVLGFVPCVLTGLGYWALDRRRRGLSLTAAVFVASLSCGLLAAASISLPFHGAGIPSIFSLSMLFLPGAVAAAVCALLIERAASRRARANKQLQRTVL